ncbi:hypothetical protein CEXT_696471 [Caerostris extrusa]|uniref:Uncharacterized protein n=1 Tax=Caerostris extrusa TaxID=172846 RepID=A0AAV4XV46_CAEEX|nr:hypothetical protein CEXT_696471 [Caerostris extrusa]
MVPCRSDAKSPLQQLPSIINASPELLIEARVPSNNSLWCPVGVMRKVPCRYSEILYQISSDTLSRIQQLPSIINASPELLIEARVPSIIHYGALSE